MTNANPWPQLPRVLGVPVFVDETLSPGTIQLIGPEDERYDLIRALGELQQVLGAATLRRLL